MHSEQEQPDPEPSESVIDDVRPKQKRRAGLLASVAVLVFALDLVTKIVAVTALEGREPIRVLGGAVYLQLVRNGGAAFGMATGMTWLLALGAIVVTGAAIWLAGRLRSPGWAFGLGLILAGAVGNLADRIFRAPGPLQGHVIDFVSLFAPDGDIWPVFNVADSAICVGAVLIVVLSLLGKDYDGDATQDKKTGHRREDAA